MEMTVQKQNFSQETVPSTAFLVPQDLRKLSHLLTALRANNTASWVETAWRSVAQALN